MKKLILLVVWLNILAMELIANEPIQINESVSLEVLDKEYVVDFRPPYCEERIITLESKSSTKKFSKIVYGRDARSIALIYDEHDETTEDIEEIFDYTEGKGVPNIPFMTLNLQIPHEAKYSVKIEDIQYIDIQTGEISSTPLLYNLNNAYLPCQEFSADEGFKDIQFDIDEYSKKQFNDIYTISEPFGALGTQGFTFNMFPFIYLPEKQSIIAIYSVRYVITIDSKLSLVDMMKNELASEMVSTSGVYIYDNYLGTIKKNSNTTDKGRYIIVTTSEKYANALEPYITHKRKYGYDVLLHVQEGGYPNNPTVLRNYIKSMYDNVGSRPQYILLVGDYEKIPVSYGVSGDENNPPTDIYYACLEKNQIGKETNFYPEVYIGRWPVSSEEDIKTIAKKVINFEQHTTWSRIFELYSGTDKGCYLTSVFNSDNRKAANKLKCINRSTVRNFKGSDGYDGMTMLYEFSHWNVLMMVYNGHGSATSLGAPYSKQLSSANIIKKDILNTPYYMVSFACELNYPEVYSFGSSWIKYGDRTVAYYGSTVTTNSSSDTYFSKHIFDYFKREQSNIQYSQLMEFSAGKYYNAFKTTARKKEAKKYLFLGDPTAYTLGMFAGEGNPQQYMPKRNDDLINNEMNLNSTEQITSIGIYNTLGQLIYTEQNVTDMGEVYNLKNKLETGIYIFQVKTTENEYVQKITL